MIVSMGSWVPFGEMEPKVILKVTIGTAASAFILGAIFWAGAAYNRLASMEAHMTSIDQKIDGYSQLIERVGGQGARIEVLEQEMREQQRRPTY